MAEDEGDLDGDYRDDDFPEGEGKPSDDELEGT